MPCFCIGSSGKKSGRHSSNRYQQRGSSSNNNNDRRTLNKSHERLTKYIEQRRQATQNGAAAAVAAAANVAGGDLDNYNGGALRNIKVLLLGAGESGKSTIARQMKMMHTSGFTESERINYLPIIYSNVLTSLRAIFEKINMLDESISCTTDVKCVENYIDKLQQAGGLLKGVTNIPQNISQSIAVILADNKIKYYVANAHHYGFSDSASYFFDNFQRISGPKYVPSVDDIIRSRVKTVGVYEIEFVYKSFRFQLTDVGGQKSERRKWLYCFQDCDMVLFVASLCDYCSTMEEDSETNRFDDSLSIFRTLLANQIFSSTTFVLILNKSDLFEKTIKSKPLSSVFPDYKGDDSFHSSCQYILDKFLKLNTDENRYIYHHITCATDSLNVEFVFRSVADSLIKDELNMI